MKKRKDNLTELRTQNSELRTQNSELRTHEITVAFFSSSSIMKGRILSLENLFLRAGCALFFVRENHYRNEVT